MSLWQVNLKYAAMRKAATAETQSSEIIAANIYQQVIGPFFDALITVAKAHITYKRLSINATDIVADVFNFLTEPHISLTSTVQHEAVAHLFKQLLSATVFHCVDRGYIWQDNVFKRITAYIATEQAQGRVCPDLHLAMQQMIARRTEQALAVEMRALIAATAVLHGATQSHRDASPPPRSPF